MAKHIATIAAYPIKDELGGGFRGVILFKATKVRKTSDEVFPTLEAARYWAKVQADEAYSEVGYSLAALRKCGEYQANVWIA